MNMQHPLINSLYATFFKGRSRYRTSRRYEVIINCLCCAGLLGLLTSATVIAFDNEMQNDQLVTNIAVLAAVLILLWWLSRSGRHRANTLACLFCSIAALANALLARRVGLPPSELIGVITISLSVTLLELQLTRAELQAEHAALEQRVIERTEQLEAEQLRRSLELQRFAEFGRLSSQLLHDVANPLAVASLYLEQADNRTSVAVKEARRSLRQLEQYVQNARQHLQQTSTPRLFTVQRELRQLLLILKPVAQRAQVRIIVCRTDPQYLYGDVVKFHQIMSNVIANAIDACKTTAQLPQRNIVTIKIMAAARHVQITVHDTGAGIEPLQLPNIFEPFYTTKNNDGRGLGIGLATVKRSLREEFNGTICAQSTLQAGTTFSLLFRYQPPAPNPELAVAHELPPLYQLASNSL